MSSSESSEDESMHDDVSNTQSFAYYTSLLENSPEFNNSACIKALAWLGRLPNSSNQQTIREISKQLGLRPKQVKDVLMPKLLWNPSAKQKMKMSTIESAGTKSKDQDKNECKVEGDGKNKGERKDERKGEYKGEKEVDAMCSYCKRKKLRLIEEKKLKSKYIRPRYRR